MNIDDKLAESLLAHIESLMQGTDLNPASGSHPIHGPLYGCYFCRIKVGDDHKEWCEGRRYLTQFGQTVSEAPAYPPYTVLTCTDRVTVTSIECDARSGEVRAYVDIAIWAGKYQDISCLWSDGAFRMGIIKICRQRGMSDKSTVSLEYNPDWMQGCQFVSFSSDRDFQREWWRTTKHFGPWVAQAKGGNRNKMCPVTITRMGLDGDDLFVEFDATRWGNRGAFHGEQGFLDDVMYILQEMKLYWYQDLSWPKSWSKSGQPNRVKFATTERFRNEWRQHERTTK